MQPSAQYRIANLSFIVLFIAVIALLMWLSRAYHVQFDWTRNARNSLSPASVAVLKKLDRPVQLTAYVSNRRNMQAGIRDLVARYQRVKPDFKLDIVNPDTDPARARAAGIQFDGEVVLEYGGNKENLTQLTERELTNALARVARSAEQWVVFLSGHGERKPDAQTNHDFGVWGAQMQKRGLKTRSLSLSENPQVPQNTAVLVIADPQVRLLAGEVKQIEKFVAQGGNLLWLIEPGSLKGLEPLAESLGLEVGPGTIIDPNSQVITGAEPTVIVVGKYSGHRTVQNLGGMTLFPGAVPLKQTRGDTPAANDANKSGWQTAVLLETLPSAWSESGAVKGAVRFDAGKDLRGPLSLGVALSREREKREQHIAVIGDADFLSNTFLGNGANLDLGMNLINWIVSDEAYIDMPNRQAVDATLNLSERAQTIIALGFFIVLPLFLLTTGIVIWWRRRRR